LATLDASPAGIPFSWSHAAALAVIIAARSTSIFAVASGCAIA
jgi:hypothetical protein